jgi:hypothetical protein
MVLRSCRVPFSHSNCKFTAVKAHYHKRMAFQVRFYQQTTTDTPSANEEQRILAYVKKHGFIRLVDAQEMLDVNEAGRLGAALAAAAGLEGLADIRARLRERRQAARGEGTARRRLAHPGWKT